LINSNRSILSGLIFLQIFFKYVYIVIIFGKCITFHFKSRTKKCWIWNYSNVSPFSFLLPSTKRNSSKTVCEMSFIVLVMETVTLFVFVFKGNWHVPVFFLIRRPGKAYGDSGELSQLIKIRYSYNKITATQIQIFLLHWNVFFSNISHQTMIKLH
jgi:hypothetical protein